jgi:Predicted dioxygenase
MRVRKPAVAGYFYESDREELLQQLDWAVKHELGAKALQLPKLGADVLGGVAPHAGYMYSGPVATWIYSALAGFGKPDVFVVVGPNHYGIGAPVAIMKSGVWETPLGRVEIDRELAERIVSRYKELEDDAHALFYEHSVGPDTVYTVLLRRRKDRAHSDVEADAVDVSRARKSHRRGY